MPDEGPFPVFSEEDVTVVDRVWITNGGPISFTLTETWAPGLGLREVEHSGGAVVSIAGRLDWQGWNLLPGTCHVLTKTFEVVPGIWETSTLTETLTVRYVDPQPVPVTLWFVQHHHHCYLPLVMRLY